jgi:uncharacterized protein
MTATDHPLVLPHPTDYCDGLDPDEICTRPVPATTKVIISETRGNVVCERTEIADTPWRRLRGLLGRNELLAGDGLLLEPAPSIHSAFMRFDFDAVFLDRGLQVVKTAERIPPWRARSAKHARSVLELSAGEVERRGVQVGDVFVIQSARDADVMTVDSTEHADAAS